MPREFRRFRNEAHFEKHFAEFATLRGWYYFKIPDVIPYTKRSGMKGVPKAHQRPFDGILAMPFGNIAIEFKMQYNKLTQHQRTALHRIVLLNGLAFVVRYIERKNNYVYQLERTMCERCEENTIIVECQNIENIFTAIEKEVK